MTNEEQHKIDAEKLAQLLAERVKHKVNTILVAVLPLLLLAATVAALILGVRRATPAEMQSYGDPQYRCEQLGMKWRGGRCTLEGVPMPMASATTDPNDRCICPPDCHGVCYQGRCTPVCGIDAKPKLVNE